MSAEDPELGAWSAAHAYRDEHEHLQAATEHVARAAAELTRAAALVGDHTSAVPLSAAIEDLQMLQAQLASASEKAFALGQMAVRRAQHSGIQRLANEAAQGPDPDPA